MSIDTQSSESHAKWTPERKKTSPAGSDPESGVIAHITGEMSIPASRTSDRDRYNYELANLAESGPMELKDGKWVKHVPDFSELSSAASGKAVEDEPSEDVPRPIRPAERGDQPAA